MNADNGGNNSPAPQNAPYASETIGIKVGALEYATSNVKERCDKLEARIKPLEDWKSEVTGMWKASRVWVALLWVVLSFAVPLVLKAAGWL